MAERIDVAIDGVGRSITVAAICTMCIGVGLGFIFGMNVYGCPWIMDRKVVNDVCQCADDPPLSYSSPRSSSIFAVVSEIRTPEKVVARERHGCTVRVLLAKDDGTRAWVDTKARCEP
jgi:hypothetical protein